MKSRGLNFLLAVAVVLCALGIMAALGIGCAAPTQLHGSVAIPSDAPKKLLTGPATGHWAEESGFPITTYTVFGADCTWLASARHQVTDDHGKFDLNQGETLCAMPLRDHQRVLFHGERK